MWLVAFKIDGAALRQSEAFMIMGGIRVDGAELFVGLSSDRSGVGERDDDDGLLGQLSSEFTVSDKGVGDLA